ncbi:hypothetical protein [Pontibacter litorisediminis]|uniref:hypothetical protein n=1 Tax=Pontibacter litorisediminis TaxID=1846260 RepID=UPI0023EE0EC1|nr:hypothetical protein [Pontibacter litorisediminis]
MARAVGVYTLYFILVAFTLKQEVVNSWHVFTSPRPSPKNRRGSCVTAAAEV